MFWGNKRADELSWADLEGLLETRTVELQTLEFKSELPSNSTSDKKEFLADISSFANARGGYLLYGVPEEEGRPVESAKRVGLSDLDVDSEKQRLENMIRAGIRPPIPGLSIHGIESDDERVVYVIHVPRSFARPHQVVAYGSFRFYSRNSTGKYPVEADELRSLYAYSSSIAARAREFRLERLGNIVSGNTPIPMSDGANITLHILPLSALDGGLSVAPSAFRGDRDNAPIDGSSQSYRFNYDGYLTWNEVSKAGQASSYFQGFRSTILEAVDSSLLDDMNRIPSIAVEANVIAAIFRYLRLIRSIGVDPPIALLFSMLGVKNYNLEVSDQHKRSIGTAFFGHRVIDRSDLIFPEHLLNEYPKDLTSIARNVRPIFDALWNAAGFERCLDYSESGEFTALQYIESLLSGI